MSDEAMKQVQPHERWPSGDSKPIAHLILEPNDLTARFGVSFVTDEDDLGKFQLAAIELGPGRQVWLVGYADSPIGGVEVFADSADDSATVLAEVFRSLSPDPRRAAS